MNTSFKINGIHHITAIASSALESTQFLFMDLMGMMSRDKQGNRYRFTMKNDEAFGHFFDVVIDSRAEKGRQSAGTVHHIAFRTPTNDEQKDWRRLLIENGFSVTPIIDRKYFQSIYFYEPGGVLFESATDLPGFAVDEPYERLGRDLKLPAQYEPMRAAIESRLPRMRPSGLAHESLRAKN